MIDFSIFDIQEEIQFFKVLSLTVMTLTVGGVEG